MLVLENAANVKVSACRTGPQTGKAAGEAFDQPEGAPWSDVRRRCALPHCLGLVPSIFTTANPRMTPRSTATSLRSPPKFMVASQEVLVLDNQSVKAGQVLVKIDPGDYQAAVDQAKASLALAEDEARSAGVDVPRTSETAAQRHSSADAQLAGAQADLLRAQATYEQAQHRRSRRCAGQRRTQPRQRPTCQSRPRSLRAAHGKR